MAFNALEFVTVLVMKLATHQKAVLVNRNISYPNMVKNSAFAFFFIRYRSKGTLKIDTKCLFILDKCKAGKE